MASVLRQTDDLQHALQSAALRVQFGNADSDTTTKILPLIVEDGPVVTGRPQARHSMLASLLVHGVLFLFFAMMAGAVGQRLDLMIEQDAIRATLADTDVPDDDVLVPQGTEIILDQTSGPAAKRTTLPASIVEISDQRLPQAVSPENVAPALGEEGKQETGVGTGGEQGLRFQKPKGGQAVTKGSFTVWTEPLDPLPNQPYLIIVQLRVPEELQTFPKSDLKIEVAGTDSFYLLLPDPKRGFQLVGSLPVVAGQAQIAIPIPGAPHLVRDAIRIESRTILKEKQSLLIEF